MNIGTVVEGETDYLLLETILLKLFPTARLFPIYHPAKSGSPLNQVKEAGVMYRNGAKRLGSVQEQV